MANSSGGFSDQWFGKADPSQPFRKVKVIKQGANGEPVESTRMLYSEYTVSYAASFKNHRYGDYAKWWPGNPVKTLYGFEVIDGFENGVPPSIPGLPPIISLELGTATQLDSAYETMSLYSKYLSNPTRKRYLSSISAKQSNNTTTLLGRNAGDYSPEIHGQGRGIAFHVSYGPREGNDKPKCLEGETMSFWGTDGTPTNVPERAMDFTKTNGDSTVMLVEDGSIIARTNFTGSAKTAVGNVMDIALTMGWAAISPTNELALAAAATVFKVLDVLDTDANKNYAEARVSVVSIVEKRDGSERQVVPEQITKTQSNISNADVPNETIFSGQGAKMPVSVPQRFSSRVYLSVYAQMEADRRSLINSPKEISATAAVELGANDTHDTIKVLLETSGSSN